MHLVLLIVIILAFVLYFKLRSNKSVDTLSKKKQYIVKMCNGNIEKAKRLVELELKKTPGISLEAAIDNTIHFIKRDA